MKIKRVKSNPDTDVAYCKKCKLLFKYEPEKSWFEEGSNYSTKLTRCPNCNRIIIIKTIVDKSETDF